MKDEKGYFYIIDAFLAVLILLIVILMVNSIVSMSIAIKLDQTVHLYLAGDR